MSPERKAGALADCSSPMTARAASTRASSHQILATYLTVTLCHDADAFRNRQDTPAGPSRFRTTGQARILLP